jgi:hypothetical protein
MTATAQTGEHAVSGPRFPLGLRGAAVAHVASIDAVAREDRPGRRVPAAGNPTATTDDESYHDSTSELPPATSHGYAEWDFSGVPDLVMFQRFLDTADYWFGHSDNSSAGSYDPARECFVVLANDQANAANAAEAGDGEVPPGPGTGPHQGAGVVWTSLGPLPRWVPGPTTRWAPGTGLALHGTCWRGAQGLQRKITRLGSCTCSALYRGLLDVLDLYSLPEPTCNPASRTI